MTKLDLAKQLCLSMLQQKEYLDTLPSNLSTALVEDALVLSLEETLRDFARAHLGNFMFEEIEWFVYDTSLPAVLVYKGVTYTFNSKEEFFDYLEKEYGDS